jgi:hypothetical protein
VKETTSKAHMQVHTNKESREKQPRSIPVVILSMFYFYVELVD